MPNESLASLCEGTFAFQHLPHEREVTMTNQLQCLMSAYELLDKVMDENVGLPPSVWHILCAAQRHIDKQISEYFNHE